jgi:hypothetical protein
MLLLSNVYVLIDVINFQKESLVYRQPAFSRVSFNAKDACACYHQRYSILSLGLSDPYVRQTNQCIRCLLPAPRTSRTAQQRRRDQIGISRRGTGVYRLHSQFRGSAATKMHADGFFAIIVECHTCAARTMPILA